MNFLQRTAIGFFVFSIVVGAVSAPLHGEPIRTGVAISIIVYGFFATGAIGMCWMADGISGVQSALSELGP